MVNRALVSDVVWQQVHHNAREVGKLDLVEDLTLSFEEIGFDSLLLVDLILAVEENLQVDLTASGAQIADLRTVGDLIDAAERSSATSYTSDAPGSST